MLFCSIEKRSVIDFVRLSRRSLPITNYNQSAFASNLAVGHSILTRSVLIFLSIVDECLSIDFKVVLPDNEAADVSFHLGGKRATPLVGPPHFEIRKSD